MILQSRDLLSRRIVVISAWVFFVLLNAFYGGALTMFFSSAPSLPFETMEEGLGRHPTWELVMQEDTEATLLVTLSKNKNWLKKWQYFMNKIKRIQPSYNIKKKRSTDKLHPKVNVLSSRFKSSSPFTFRF